MGLDGISGKRVSDQHLREVYAEFHNIETVAQMVGLHASSVHERLKRLGVKTPPSHLVPFSDEEKERLRREYITYRDAGKLADLALSLGRGKTSIVRMARALGLMPANGKGRRRLDNAVWKYMDERQATLIWDDFKSQRMGLGHYCKKKGYDDLGFMRKMKEFFGDEWEHVIESKASRQGLYRIGRALEYRTRDFLERVGYFVLRSPASKSPIDLAAIKRGEVLFIQSKKAGTLGVAEWNAIFNLALSVGAVALMSTGHQSGRGIVFMRLLDTKDGSKRKQPWETWSPKPTEPGLFDREEKNA